MIRKERERERERERDREREKSVLAGGGRGAVYFQKASHRITPFLGYSLGPLQSIFGCPLSPSPAPWGAPRTGCDVWVSVPALVDGGGVMGGVVGPLSHYRQLNVAL